MKHHLDLCFRVLLSHERGDYVAHALELDLLGIGDSPNKALTDLRNAVMAQLTFAMQMHDPDLLPFDAPADVVQRWEEAARNNLRDLAAGDVPMKVRCEATFLEIPAADVDAMRRKAERRTFHPEPARAHA